jgi:SAM-dependent methyltransferase
MCPDLDDDPGASTSALSGAKSYPAGFRTIFLSDRDLADLNQMLAWHAGTTLADGRLLGRLGAIRGKRDAPQRIPDKRIALLDQKISLRDKSILEVGCFEGIHTVGLRIYSDDVTAVDIRPINVVKTLARLAYHGTYAKVFQADIEQLPAGFGSFDVIFHCGVLYHLMNPAEHLQRLGGMSRHLFLDTHVEEPETAVQARSMSGKQYWGAYHDEEGWCDPFSGKDRKAFWLRQDSLELLLAMAGFHHVEILQRRDERNGPRIALLASRD